MNNIFTCFSKSKIILVSFMILLTSATTFAREDFFLHPKFEPKIGYSAGVKVGNTLYIAGTTGSGTTMEEQIQSAYGKIEKVLKHYNTDFSHVVKETVFVTDIDALIKASDTRKAFYGHKPGTRYPASSWIGVDRLYDKRLMIEIELIVQLDQ